MRRLKLCQHVKDNGKLCGSPAMRNKQYCHSHLELVRRRQRMARMARERLLLADAKLHQDKTLALNTYVANILGHYSPAKSVPSIFCAEEGEGGTPAAD